MHPDLFADEGEHRFTYSLLPHEGDWTAGGVAQEAFALNSPLCAATFLRDAGTLPPGSGLVAAEGVALALGSLKEAADGGGALILRLYEPHGTRGESILRFARDIERADRVNLLEEADGGPSPTVERSTLRVKVRPFEVLTLRLELRASPTVGEA